MPNTRKIMLDKFGITEARYEELRGLCRQYFEKKEKIRDIYELSGFSSGEVVDGGSVGRPTEEKVMKAQKYIEDIEKIDKALDYASERYGEWMKRALIDSIIRGVKLYELELYCKPKIFYACRVLFYRKLDSLL